MINGPKISGLSAEDKKAAEAIGLDVGALVENMMASLQNQFEAATHRVGGEIQDLVEYIGQTKAELAALSPNSLSKYELPDASDQLDEIIKATEVAAGDFMDAAEDLQALAENADDATADKLQSIATRIFEAASFQDIAGQRITRVIKVLKVVEDRLTVIADSIGDEAEAPGLQDGEELLQGPALPGQGNNQADVDALFSGSD